MGFFKFIDHSPAIKSQHEDACKRALEAVGLCCVGKAQDLSPHDSGLLRNSLSYALAGESPNISSYTDDAGKQRGYYNGSAPTDGKPTVYIGTNVEYSIYQELGTYKMAANAFLKPAAAGNAGEFKSIIETYVKV